MNGIYYQLEIPQQVYSQINLQKPLQTRNLLLSYNEPSWVTTLDFIPIVAVNNLDCSIKFAQSFIQDLINCSLQLYRLSCNLGWLEQASAASHLVIKGKNLDINDFPIGAGAIHVLNDETAEEYYVTPSTAGLTEIKEHINQVQGLIDSMQYSLLHAGDNSSGESLKFRIAVKCSDLVNLVKNIGKAITISLQFVDAIMNGGQNKDLIEYIPYIDFDKINTYLGNEDITEKNDNSINIVNEDVPQEK